MKFTLLQLVESAVYVAHLIELIRMCVNIGQAAFVLLRPYM